ncbi:MAG TPA: riboflavin synthase [Candidatus Avidehalobacter gallistercoris]|uniref:Riboflavin synthase n=1 Tax=Candidatus Avidehalobacter gallistercoris TaxID=2840694 RepID=A0A9D1KXW7_9FIRM|nr:riboflavin synthase [Candidatus Avidehalobacter gallistercoris]
MFTGIIEEVGIVRAVRHGARSAVLQISAQVITADLNIGDSVAVNGVCLTVTQLSPAGFTVDVMPETLSRSNLSVLVSGSRVNLERALPAGGRFGGHIVSGHIDGVGRVKALRRDDNALWYEISAAPELLRYIVEKGSVAVDGISLTVAWVTSSSFAVSVIPHTAAVTVLTERRVGDGVNLECDIIAKYVEKLVAPAKTSQVSLTREFLLENGF